MGSLAQAHQCPQHSSASSERCEVERCRCSHRCNKQLQLPLSVVVDVLDVEASIHYTKYQFHYIRGALQKVEGSRRCCALLL